jgi:nucleoside-diphosphate-sugar epimerase
VPFIVAYFGGWVLYIITIGMIDYREKIQRLVEPRVFDHSDAARDFGYSPVTFEEGVKAEIDEYKKFYHKTI